jgi:hypothetical protein
MCFSVAKHFEGEANPSLHLDKSLLLLLLPLPVLPRRKSDPKKTAPAVGSSAADK